MRAEVRLSVYNLLGQEVRRLMVALQVGGIYTVLWGGRDDEGRELANGVYFYRLRFGGQVEKHRLRLLR
ncbi:MAG: hypothetical protein HY681_02110 [Chloroflexi bacterium]|nr:hypothetical protein [Chloroflexota bacterium]